MESGELAGEPKEWSSARRHLEKNRPVVEHYFLTRKGNPQNLIKVVHMLQSKNPVPVRLPPHTPQAKKPPVIVHPLSQPVRKIKPTLVPPAKRGIITPRPSVLKDRGSMGPVGLGKPGNLKAKPLAPGRPPLVKSSTSNAGTPKAAIQRKAPLMSGRPMAPSVTKAPTTRLTPGVIRGGPPKPAIPKPTVLGKPGVSPTVLGKPGVSKLRNGRMAQTPQPYTRKPELMKKASLPVLKLQQEIQADVESLVTAYLDGELGDDVPEVQFESETQGESSEIVWSPLPVADTPCKGEEPNISEDEGVPEICGSPEPPAGGPIMTEKVPSPFQGTPGSPASPATLVSPEPPQCQMVGLGADEPPMEGVHESPKSSLDASSKSPKYSVAPKISLDASPNSPKNSESPKISLDASPDPPEKVGGSPPPSDSPAPKAPEAVSLSDEAEDPQEAAADTPTFEINAAEECCQPSPSAEFSTTPLKPLTPPSSKPSSPGSPREGLPEETFSSPAPEAEHPDLEFRSPIKPRVDEGFESAQDLPGDLEFTHTTPIQTPREVHTTFEPEEGSPHEPTTFSISSCEPPETSRMSILGLSPDEEADVEAVDFLSNQLARSTCTPTGYRLREDSDISYISDG